MCKLGVNDTIIHKLIDLKDENYEQNYELKNDFRIMDTSRQPNSYNRCLNSKCSQSVLIYVYQWMDLIIDVFVRQIRKSSFAKKG